MTSALIFLHGDLSDANHLLASATAADVIIAADGGAEHAVQAGITPHIVIGDLDSISTKTRKFLEKKSRWQIYPREKDYTDAELAIQCALDQKVTTIYIAGFLGRRLDHMMANLCYLSTLPVEIVLIEGSQTLSFVKKEAVILGKKGDELSLIPLRDDCSGVATAGLIYPLHAETLPYGTTRGVSNVMTSTKASISLTSGILLCIHSIKKE